MVARGKGYSYYYSATIGVRSIVINPSVCAFVCLCVCLFVCLSVREHISGIAGTGFTKFCTQIPCGRGLTWSSSGGVALRYVLPVSWMTSHLAAVGRMSVHALSLSKYRAPRGVARPGGSLMSINALLNIELILLTLIQFSALLKTVLSVKSCHFEVIEQ